MKTYVQLWQYLAQFFLKREVFKKKKSCSENKNTHSVFNSSPLPSSPHPENRSICEIMWKYIVEPERP
jgi:hypothetical protein